MANQNNTVTSDRPQAQQITLTSCLGSGRAVIAHSGTFGTSYTCQKCGQQFTLRELGYQECMTAPEHART